jgi:5-methylcytosine-specific restriction endonuclease McrA
MFSLENSKISSFLIAMKKEKYRKCAGPFLRSLIAKKEMSEYGVLACYCCGQTITKKKSTTEHILPRSLGGKTELNNLALSHKECNESRGNCNTKRSKIVLNIC